MFMARAIRIVFLFFLSVIGAVPAKAQMLQAKGAVSPVDGVPRVTIPNSTYRLAVPANDVGPLDGSTPLQRMVLILGASPEQEYQARTLLDRQQTKGSPEYHRWLTPEEFGQRFGPSLHDLAQVTDWLQQQGFSIGNVARSRRWIEFSGTSAQVEAAFQTTMRQYVAEGELHVANAADISIPVALVPAVRGLLSLHNFYSKPVVRRAEGVGPVKLDRSNPDATAGDGSHFITPGDLATIYNLNPLYQGTTPVKTITGSGQAIAVVAASNINLDDIAAFQTVFGLSQNPPNIILNGSDPGMVAQFSEEASIDVEYSGAIAPNATIDLVVSGGTLTTDPIPLSASFIVDQNLAPIMSMSFSRCEGDTEDAFWNALWEQAAAQGISVFVSSGDSGAGCGSNIFFGAARLGVNGRASTPFNTAVGGTEFDETVNGGLASTFWSSTNGSSFASAVGYIPEKVWNDSFFKTNSEGVPPTISLASGGGGLSTIYAAPSYQTLPIQGLVGANFPNRSLPDVSLVAASAHDPYVFCFSTPTQPDCRINAGQVTFNNFAGGTSFSAPEFAGIMALVNQAVGSPQGLANYVLYSLAAAESSSFGSCNSSNQTNPLSPPGSQCVLNDVTAGNNGVPGLDQLSGFIPPGDVVGQTGYKAVAGYDPASGLGSVNAATLVNAWAALANGFQGSTTNLSASFNGTPLPANNVTITHGQAVSVTVSVARQGTNGTPSGNVSLIAQGGNLPPGTIGITGQALTGTGGTATAGPLNVNNLPGGTNYNLLASFPGDGIFAGSTSNPINLTVQPENTNTGLQSFQVNCPEGVQGSIDPGSGCGISTIGATTIDYGDSTLVLALQAKTVGSSGLIPASGTVTFAFGGTTLPPVPINNNGIAEVADCLPPLSGCLPPGQYAVTATYSGDGLLSYQGSTTVPLNITVTKGNPVPRILVPAKVGIGAAFTLGAQIPSGFGILVPGVGSIVPTGTVQFFDGTNPPTPLGAPLTLSGGQASMQAVLNTGGSHALSVQYSGDSTYNAETEAFVDIQVGSPFNFGATATSQTIAAGGTATYSLTLSTSPDFPGFSGVVLLDCAGAPGGSTCTVSPNSATLLNTVTSVPLTVTVSNTANAHLTPNPWRLPLVLAGCLATGTAVFKRRMRRHVLMVLTVSLVAALISCGGGGGGGSTNPRQPTNATLTVTGKDSGGDTDSINLSLTITH